MFNVDYDESQFRKV
ncbi:hypothetical protein F383_18472 [Gossypium arboreum]|uniref:Uncharacterized protein n=1 Tax=Gossypium arboreum TaxID=29729 RepID=A0A0B0NK57_GOSAR|nr:hypothetical protein F383_18472 [Gossypium arboreum]